MIFWMKKKTKVILGLFSALAGCMLCFFIIQGMEQARESEAKTQLSSLVTAQAAFHAEYGQFSEDFEKIGYSPEGRLRGQIFLTKEKLPPQILSKLPEEALPFVGKDSFRFIYVMGSGDNYSCFTIDEKKTYKRVSLRNRSTD